jgi:hypothetical protein
MMAVLVAVFTMYAHRRLSSLRTVEEQTVRNIEKKAKQEGVGKRFLLHLASVVAFVIFMWMIVMSIAAWDHGNFLMAALWMLFSFTALWGVYDIGSRYESLRGMQERKAGEDWYDNLHMAHEQKIGERLQNDELVVGMRWGAWLVLTIFFALIAGVSIQKIENGSFWSALACSFVLLIMCFVLLNFAWLAWHVVRAGNVLRINASGLSYCLIPEIVWKDVIGLDLRIDVGYRDHKTYSLVLALNRSAAETLRQSRLSRACTGLALNVSNGKLVIPCLMIAASPYTLCAVAKRFAKQANPAFEPDWNQYQSVDAIANQKREKKSVTSLQAQFDQLYAQFQTELHQLPTETIDEAKAVKLVEQLGRLSLMRLHLNELAFGQALLDLMRQSQNRSLFGRVKHFKQQEKVLREQNRAKSHTIQDGWRRLQEIGHTPNKAQLVEISAQIKP